MRGISSKPKTVVSLFAGAGGLDLGLKQAGLDIIWANDFDQDSCDTYRLNVDERIVCGDISKIPSSDIPSADIIAGGFPCQGFSVANKFRSTEDNRNQLYLEMLRIIKDKQPKWFIAENVKGILSLDKGKVFEMILQDFKEAGYHVEYQLVNMADFGVPQMRKRVLILGTRSDLPDSMHLHHPEPTHSENPTSGMQKWVTAGEAMTDFKKYIVPHDLQSGYKFVERNFTGHRKTNPDKPAPTILARGNGKGGNNATPHPLENRRMSVMESAYIQSFPPEFKFQGKMTSQYRQIGNAVPVLYGKHLGEKLNQIKEEKTVAKSQSNQLTVASLFSGAGGLDLGFQQAGYKLVWANDNDHDSVETYKLNFGEHCVLGDVEQLDLSSIPDVDIIIGGFPCQGFSVANMKRHAADSRNVLYKSFVNAVTIKQPKYFLAENVKGILSIEKGEVFKLIVEEFSNAGYRCRYALVNAANYGAPQNRQRVLIFGVRKDLDVIDFEWPPLPTHIDNQISIGEALKDLPDPDGEHNLENHVYSAFKLKFNGYISNRAVDPNKPSPTITARGDTKGGAMIIHHPNNLRRITCREAAVIQGFPLDFKFYGSMTSVYRQVGNAVPSQLAFAAAKQIKKYDQLATKALTVSDPALPNLDFNLEVSVSKDFRQASLLPDSL